MQLNPRFVPSNTYAVPLVATLDAFRNNTPLAVPPVKVGEFVNDTAWAAEIVIAVVPFV